MIIHVINYMSSTMYIMMCTRLAARDFKLCVDFLICLQANVYCRDQAHKSMPELTLKILLVIN